MEAANPNRMRRVRLSLLAIAAAMLAVFVILKAAPERGVVIAAGGASVEDAATRAEFERAFEAGLEAFRRGEAHAAMVAFEEAARLRPASSQAHVNLGFALVELKAWAAAREHFERALEASPDQFNAYYGIAEALEGQGLVEQAAGAMKTYLYFAPASDPFRRRAEAALWEWGAPFDSAAEDADTSPTTDYSGSLHGLSVRDLTGNEVSFSQFEGKVLVLNIWASWCPPCRRELPALEALSRRLDRDRFAVIGLSVDDNPDYIQEYLRRIDVDFPNLWDEKQRLSAEIFNVDAYPTTLIVSAQGKIEKKIVGFREWTSAEMINEIEAVR